MRCMTDAELIEFHGGPTKLAKRLGYPENGGVQRVQNWVKRGIPPAVKVKYPSLFLRPNRKAKPTQAA